MVQDGRVASKLVGKPLEGKGWQAVRVGANSGCPHFWNSFSNQPSQYLFGSIIMLLAHNPNQLTEQHQTTLNASDHHHWFLDHELNADENTQTTTTATTEQFGINIDQQLDAYNQQHHTGPHTGGHHTMSDASGSAQSKQDRYNQVTAHQQVVPTLSPAYRQQHGRGIYGPEDADWITRRLAQQYKQERVGHEYTLSACRHEAPTTTGNNFLWNTIKQKEENNVSYYERQHETMISGTQNSDSGIAGSWLTVLNSKPLESFLPSPNNNSMLKAKQTAKKRADFFGKETDWLATPSHGVTGKQEYNKYTTSKHLSSRQQNQSATKTNSDQAPGTTYYSRQLHKALRHDSSHERYGENYVTHRTGNARACKGSNSVWNTQQAKSSQTNTDRRMRNPPPARIAFQINRNRQRLINYQTATRRAHSSK
jgi:hypothetical protein